MNVNRTRAKTEERAITKMEDTPAAVCHSGVEKTVMKVRCEFCKVIV